MHLDGKFGISKDDTSYRDKEAGSEVFQFHHSSWSLGSFFLVVIQWLSHVWPFETPWTAVLQASLSITNSRSPPKPMSIGSVMPSNHLILCHPLLLLHSVFPSIMVFSSESALHIRWTKYWSFSFNISPSNEHPGLISFRMDLAYLSFTYLHSLKCECYSKFLYTL